MGKISVVPVSSLARSSRIGWLTAGALRIRCALGRSGRLASKREGDGGTPEGRFRLIAVYWRPDRVRRPTAGCRVLPIRRDLGWCDAAGDRNYNRAVRLPYPASAEQMWRDDRLYDVVVVLDHNHRPRQRGRGSAIFMHVARDGLGATEGCIALRYGDLVRLLAVLDRGAELVVGRDPRRR